jgi:hypothetical protein
MLNENGTFQRINEGDWNRMRKERLKEVSSAENILIIFYKLQLMFFQAAIFLACLSSIY